VIDPSCWTRRRAALAALMVTLLGSAQPATAGSSRLAAAPALPGYAEECGTCHTAYVPGLLPAASWQRLMSSLDAHFGLDASLDTAAARRISGWLQVNAASSPRWQPQPPEDRITRSAGFVRKHREIPAWVWSHPQVRRASQCASCHPGAERGDFDDDRLRLPAGLGRAMRPGGHD
jgi:hypothetical protein